MNSTTKQRHKQLPSVSGTAKVLQPVGSVGRPEHNQGEIALNGKPYFVRVTDTCYSLFGFDERRQTPTHYDVSADCEQCDCPDYISRHDRREDGLCKHAKGIRALVAAGKLPAIASRQTPVCRRPACLCTVCGVNSVDAENGDDTCWECANAA